MGFRASELSENSTSVTSIPFKTPKHKVTYRKVKWKRFLWHCFRQLPYFEAWATPKALSNVFKRDFKLLITENDVKAFFRQANEILLQDAGFKKTRHRVANVKSQVWITKRPASSPLPPADPFQLLL